jgi:hypothetical protein
MNASAPCSKDYRIQFLVLAVLACTVGIPSPAVAQLCDECHELIVWSGSQATYYHSFEDETATGLNAGGVFRQCSGTVDLQSDGSDHQNCHPLMVEGDCGTHDLCGGGNLAMEISTLLDTLRSIGPSGGAAEVLAKHVVLRSNVELIKEQGAIRIVDCEGTVVLAEHMEPALLRAVALSLETVTRPTA